MPMSQELVKALGMGFILVMDSKMPVSGMEEIPERV
jgi:hypothetical protein